MTSNPAHGSPTHEPSDDSNNVHSDSRPATSNDGALETRQAEIGEGGDEARTDVRPDGLDAPNSADESDRQPPSMQRGRLRRSSKDREQLAEESTLPPRLSDNEAFNPSTGSPERPSSERSAPSSRDSSRPVSSLSQTSNLSLNQPFERRFQTRKPSSQQLALRKLSPAFLGSHSRQSSVSSQLSFGSLDQSEDDQAPWEVVRWTKLKKISSLAFSETARRAFGQRTHLSVAASIVVGTSKGLVLVFDYQQNLKHILGQGSVAAESGAVTSLAISADHSTIAAGHANGAIITWDMTNPTKPFLHISPLPRKGISNRSSDSHVSGHAVLQVGFLGTRHTALVSADESGMAFSHLASRGLGAVGRTVKSTRILGRYPEMSSEPSPTRKPSTVLACSPLPLGNVEQSTDDLGLTALLTPYLMVIISTTPVARTQYKNARTQDGDPHGPLTGSLAWFPAVKLKESSNPAENTISRTKLAYCWSNMLSILEIQVEEQDPEERDQPPNIKFKTRSTWKNDEAIVAVQWLSRSILALLTITQRLIILDDRTLRVSDSADLNPKHIFHADLFSEQLQAFADRQDHDDVMVPGIIPDAFGMSFKAYKGRLFLLGANDVSMGTLSNWSDRLTALVGIGRPVAAIDLAIKYYSGDSNHVAMGLPEQPMARQAALRERILEMVKGILKLTFKKDNDDELDTDLRSAMQELVDPISSACLRIGDIDFLFDEVYEWYSDASCQDFFLYSLEPRILDNEIKAIPPEILKDFVNWFASHNLGDRLEELLCSLDTTTMDLDQVTSLCKTYNLYDALIYVWNQALGDYLTPTLELIELMSGSESSEKFQESPSQTHRESASKLFPYLAFSLTGRVYPYGSDMAPNDAKSAKASLYGLLFSGRAVEWPVRSGKVAEAGIKAIDVSYPYLRAIIHFDSPSFMSMMNETFEDAFLNGGTEQLANGVPHIPDSREEISSGTSINRQRIVSILLEVMRDDTFSLEQRVFLDMFIARNLPKFSQFILLPGYTLRKILIELCEYPVSDLAEECQLSVEYLLSVYRPSDLEDLAPLFKKAGFYRILKSVYRASKQYARWIYAHFEDPDDAQAVFNAIADCLRPNSGLKQKQTREVKMTLLHHGRDLVDIDVARTATTFLEFCQDLLKPFFDTLDSDPRSQYLFLKSLLEPTKIVAAPSALRDGPESRFAHEHRERYVRLMCQYDRNHVADYINTSELSDLRLGEILPAMEKAGAIDAAIVLLARDGLVRDAMDRLAKYLGAAQTALSNMLEHDVAAEMDGSSPPRIDEERQPVDEILDTVPKYVRLGIWLCQTAQQYISPEDQKKSKEALRKKPTDITESDLTTIETLWLDLLSSVVKLSLVTVSTGSPSTPPTAANLPQHTNRDVKTSASQTLRTSVQTSFTALLTATSTTPSTKTSQGQTETRKQIQPHFLPILRLFLTRLTTSQSTTLPSLRPTLHIIFQAYAFEESLLDLATSLLDKDVFVSVEESRARRSRGWRPNGRACARCGERVWGVGAGVELWEAWRAKREDTVDKAGRAAVEGKGKGKGKGRAVDAEVGVGDSGQNADGEAGVDSGADGVVVFACGHLLHRSCVAAVSKTAEDGLHGEARETFRCPVCLG